MPGPEERPSRQEPRIDIATDGNAAPPDPAAPGISQPVEPEASMAAAGPTNWWLYGLCALAIIVAILLAMQIFSGAPGTDMQPGTPVSEPVTEAPPIPVQ